MLPIQYLNQFMKGDVQPEQIKTDFSYISKGGPKEGYQKVQELSEHYNKLGTFKFPALRNNIYIVQNVFNRAADALFLHQKLTSKKVFDLRSESPESSTRDEMEVFGNLHAIQSSAVNCHIVPEFKLPEGCTPLFITAVVDPILKEIERIQDQIESICTKEIDEETLMLSLSHETPVFGVEAKDMGYVGPNSGTVTKRSIKALCLSEGIGLKKLEKPKDMDLETFNKYQSIYSFYLIEIQETMTKIKTLFIEGIHWVIPAK